MQRYVNSFLEVALGLSIRLGQLLNNDFGSWCANSNVTTASMGNYSKIRMMCLNIGWHTICISAESQRSSYLSLDMSFQKCRRRWLAKGAGKASLSGSNPSPKWAGATCNIAIFSKNLHFFLTVASGGGQSVMRQLGWMLPNLKSDVSYQFPCKFVVRNMHGKASHPCPCSGGVPGRERRGSCSEGPLWGSIFDGVTALISLKTWK